MDRHRRAFERFAQRAEKLSGVDEIVLFGSVARGEHGHRSDVDVLVRVSDDSERQRIEELALETTEETGISVSAVTVEKDAKDSDFLRTVEEEGETFVRG